MKGRIRRKGRREKETEGEGGRRQGALGRREGEGGEREDVK